MSDQLVNTHAREKARKKPFDPSIGKSTQIKPGEVRNPGGRPKKLPFTEMFQELANEIASDPQMRAVFKESIKRKLHSERVIGAMTMDSVLNRVEGKLTQPIDVSGEVDIVGIIESGRKRLKE